MEASPRLLNYIPKDPHILTTRMATWEEQYGIGEGGKDQTLGN